MLKTGLTGLGKPEFLVRNGGGVVRCRYFNCLLHHSNILPVGWDAIVGKEFAPMIGL